jgi:hypothetical protein
MTGNRNRDLWRDEAHAYAVFTGQGAMSKSERSGLSHVEAMTLAEQLLRDGKTATVKHVIGGASYEVDRYPAR